MKYSYVVVVGFVLFSACKKKEQPTPVVPVTPVTPLVQDNRFPVNLLVDSVTLAYIKLEAVSNTEMSTAIATIINSSSLAALSKTPTLFKEGDSDNFSNISNQATDCKMLALRWLMLYEKSPD